MESTLQTSISHAVYTTLTKSTLQTGLSNRTRYTRSSRIHQTSFSRGHTLRPFAWTHPHDPYRHNSTPSFCVDIYTFLFPLNHCTKYTRVLQRRMHFKDQDSVLSFRHSILATTVSGGGAYYPPPKPTYSCIYTTLSFTFTLQSSLSSLCVPCDKSCGTSKFNTSKYLALNICGNFSGDSIPSSY